MAANRPGVTLREYIEAASCSLRERMELCRRLICLVESFHTKCRMIHGDITPDNIFLLDTENGGEQNPSGVLTLLDFGLTRSLDSVQTLPVGGTEGYTHPKLLCGHRTVLLESDDRYNVFACCWFCFSGCSPDEYEITDEHIEAVCETLALSTVRNGFPDSSDHVEIQFLQTYQTRRESILMMLKDMFLYARGEPHRLIDLAETVRDILDQSGIDRKHLAVSLREEYLELRQDRFANVDIIGRILPHVDFQFSHNLTLVSRSKQGRPEPLHQVMRSCTESLFMIGDGGMGKTTSLLQVMDDTYRSDNTDKSATVIFLELYTLSQNPDDWYSPEHGGTFIEQFVASYFTQRPRRYMPKDHPYVGPLREEFFRVPRQGKCQYTVLLDGANEVGFSSEQNRKVFLDALNHYLSRARNLRIILTGRSDIYELSSQKIQRIYTRGLDDLAIEEMLLSAVDQGKLSSQEYRRITTGRHDFFSSDYRLWQCLQVPFFLMMYCVTQQRGDGFPAGRDFTEFFQRQKGNVRRQSDLRRKGEGAAAPQQEKIP